jgi:hypothetical protein
MLEIFSLIWYDSEYLQVSKYVIPYRILKDSNRYQDSDRLDRDRVLA